MAQREKEPFIHKGDRVVINGGLGAGGPWDVMNARWAKRDDDSDHSIEIVLGRGGSTRFKIVFNEATMQHHSNWPSEVLSRDIRVKKPLQYRPK